LTEYSSNQNVIQKYVATKDPHEARKSIWICCLCSVPTWAFFLFLGTSLYVFFKLNPDPDAQAMLLGAGGKKAESILPYFVIKFLPPGMSGLVLAGVLAAAMSSLSSSINAVSAVSIVDVYKRHLVKDRDDSHYVIVAKLVALACSIIMILGAALLMWAQSKTLQDTATKLGALIAGGLLGLYMLGFLTRKGNLAALVLGIGSTLCYSAWMMAIELKWITTDLFLGMGCSKGWATWLSKPMDTYYTGLIGNIIMFAVAYALGSLIKGRPSDLKNLTIWDQDGTPIG